MTNSKTTKKALLSSSISILLCFGALTVSWHAKRNMWRYYMTICGEISLVILLNAIYYFLISICISK